MKLTPSLKRRIGVLLTKKMAKYNVNTGIRHIPNNAFKKELKQELWKILK